MIGDAPVQVGGDGCLRRVQVGRIVAALVEPEEQQRLPGGAPHQPRRPVPAAVAGQGPVRHDLAGLQARVDQDGSPAQSPTASMASENPARPP